MIEISFPVKINGTAGTQTNREFFKDSQ